MCVGVGVGVCVWGGGGGFINYSKCHNAKKKKKNLKGPKNSLHYDSPKHWVQRKWKSLGPFKSLYIHHQIYLTQKQFSPDKSAG